VRHGEAAQVPRRVGRTVAQDVPGPTAEPDHLDAETFPIDFNDIDLCLRLGARGWTSIWTPRATLAHQPHSSSSPKVVTEKAG
jgi:hypothetical protein